MPFSGVLNLFFTWVHHMVSIDSFQRILETNVHTIFGRFEKGGSGECLWETEKRRETQNDVHGVCTSSEAPGPGLVGSVSLRVSGSGGLTLEFVKLGPGSLVSHTQGGSAFVSLNALVSIRVCFLLAHTIPVSEIQNMQTLSTVFSLSYFLWWCFLRFWKSCLKFRVWYL